jgi:hypothetical protein
MIMLNNIEDIEKMVNTNEIMLLKFDNIESKYNEYIDGLDLKVINITDKEIIEFYDIDILPTVLVYKNNNLIDSIQGFQPRTIFLKKILTLTQN